MATDRPMREQRSREEFDEDRLVGPDLARIRRDVAALHEELVRYNLVTWTAGNVSGRVPGHDLFVVKPSGIDYAHLTPDELILCTLDGKVVPGHGPFTIGRSPRDAVKAAVMVEDVARTVHLARQLGETIPVAQDAIDQLFRRYQHVYGQAPQGEL